MDSWSFTSHDLAVAGFQDAFPEMLSCCRQSFTCIHKKPHQWKGCEAKTQAGDTGGAVQTSQGAVSAVVALAGSGGNQCTVVSIREEGHSDSGPLHPSVSRTTPTGT